LIINVIILVI